MPGKCDKWVDEPIDQISAWLDSCLLVWERCDTIIPPSINPSTNHFCLFKEFLHIHVHTQTCIKFLYTVTLGNNFFFNVTRNSKNSYEQGAWRHEKLHHYPQKAIQAFLTPKPMGLVSATAHLAYLHLACPPQRSWAFSSFSCTPTPALCLRSFIYIPSHIQRWNEKGKDKNWTIIKEMLSPFKAHTGCYSLEKGEVKKEFSMLISRNGEGKLWAGLTRGRPLTTTFFWEWTFLKEPRVQRQRAKMQRQRAKIQRRCV